MPVYEYVCEDCNERFEARVGSWSQADSAHCKSCDGENVRRLISRVAFMSVGSDIPMSSAQPSTGGCCSGSCGCHCGRA
jgi:putative FmdB family regulatory protein